LPTDLGELAQGHDDRAFFQASPDELPANVAELPAQRKIKGSSPCYRYNPYGGF
jgi:hypothetical protein